MESAVAKSPLERAASRWRSSSAASFSTGSSSELKASPRPSSQHSRTAAASAGARDGSARASRTAPKMTAKAPGVSKSSSMRHLKRAMAASSGGTAGRALVSLAKLSSRLTAPCAWSSRCALTLIGER